MEKIYEEKSSGQDVQNRKKLNFSIVLSFIVAAFAIVSLIAVGFNQISFAAPTGTETMTLHYGRFDASTLAYIQGTGTTGGLRVQMYFSDSEDANTATKPLFCIQHDVDPTDQDDAYSSEGEIFSDFGLVYIMNQSSLLGGDGIIHGTLTYPGTSNEISEEDYRFLEYYATQAAIWKYMYDTQPENNPDGTHNNYHGKLERDHQLEALTGTVQIVSSKNSTKTIYSGNLYDQFIEDVVYDAEHATSYRTVQAKLDSNSITTDTNTQTYQTDKIRVVASPSDDLYGYYVDLSGLDGAYIVDSEGRTRTAYDRFEKTDYFYIRVPIDKVKADSSKVKLTITGEFDNFVGGEQFAAGNNQSVVAVTYERYRTFNESEINFMAAPDTGMTTAQTIYFIGLIVLLCGVGIIYANAKPVEE